MRKKIFSYYSILILICMSITGIFTFYLTRHFYKTEVEERMKSCALLIRHHLLEELHNGEAVDFNEAAKFYSEVLNSEVSGQNKIRITFIDSEGRVLGDSEADYHTMENHLNRKEIQEAIHGSMGKDIRFSNTLNMDFLYIAFPVKEIKTIVRLSVPLTQIQKIYSIILNYEFLGLLASITLTLIVTLRFSSSITDPIDELILKSGEISSGNYKVRAEIKSRDEIAQLAETFNNMASQLEKTVYDLKDRNLKMDTILNNMTDGIIAVDKNSTVVLINSVAYRLFNISFSEEEVITGKKFVEIVRNTQVNKMLNETLKNRVVLSEEINMGYSGNKVYRITTVPVQAELKSEQIGENDESFIFGESTFSEFSHGAVISVQDITNIKKLEQIRTEFVSNVTHELKTPLTSIRGFVETLRNGAVNDKEVADKFLEIIDIEAERLYTLINDILQLSEIESRKSDINIETFNIKHTIDECVEILKPEADRKGIVLQTENVDDKLLMNANKDRIKQMLINLVDNGIKYNITGGSVFISAYREEGCLIIRIKDTGIGIPEEHLPRIFERFYRVDKGRSRSMGGTGLGLSIVKHIVNLYNGDINVRSQIGQGTEFIVRFPYK
ncbi:MAG: HAMP domain-containing protein [Firmicutes bacterium]|nr:HAMP domain-containing protein [Bacillota bacterium]